jgi:hypothetical protein
MYEKRREGGRKIWRETTLEKVGGVREVGRRKKSMMAAVASNFLHFCN